MRMIFLAAAFSALLPVAAVADTAEDELRQSVVNNGATLVSSNRTVVNLGGARLRYWTAILQFEQEAGKPEEVWCPPEIPHALACHTLRFPDGEAACGTRIISRDNTGFPDTGVSASATQYLQGCAVNACTYPTRAQLTCSGVAEIGR